MKRFHQQRKRARRILKKNKIKNETKKRQNTCKGGKGEGRGLLTVGGDLVGGVQARVSAGGGADVQVEQDVLPQPEASFF